MPPLLEEPIRAELFGIERLEQHAESLAVAQRVMSESGQGRRLLPRVQDNGRVLREAYRVIARAVREERAITPAAEWLVDNFHLVDEQLREIRDSDFRDALFVGSTYGPQGVTVAARIGFDDNHALGEKETGGRTALPIFREIMLRVYERQLVGPVPQFPREIEDGIDQYLVRQAALKAERDTPALEGLDDRLIAPVVDLIRTGEREHALLDEPQRRDTRIRYVREREHLLPAHVR